MKRGQHALDLLTTPRRTLSANPAGSRVPIAASAASMRCAGPRLLVEPDVDAIDAAQAIEGQLCGRDVHQHETAVHHARRAFVREQPADDVGVDPIAGHQRTAAEGQPAAAARASR